MKEGKTSTGFNYILDESKADDWELLENLRRIDKGEQGLVVDVAEELLGTDQLNKLKKHVKELEGRVSITGVLNEISEILGGDSTIKNL